MLRILGLICILASQAACVTTGTDKGPFTDLNYGQHAVGVRFEHDKDLTRPMSNGDPRTIQITVWYPAVIDHGMTPMTFADYYGYKSSEFDQDKQDSVSRAAALQQFREFVMQVGPKESDVKSLLAESFVAELNADPADGKFPLLVYAPSFGSSPSENIVLCEYLASHGYIVAASPSAGKDNQEMESSIEGLKTQAADLDFVLKRMESEKNVDRTKIGTFGFSWGGLSNVLFALKHDAIKVVASLDGSIFAPVHQDIVNALAELKPEKITVPFLYFASYRVAPKPDLHDYSFLNKVVNSERYLLKLNGLGHGNFSSQYISAFQYFNAGMKKGIAAGRAFDGYKAVCFYLLKFFDAHLKGDASAKEVFSQSPDEHGFTNDRISIEHWKPKEN